MILSGINRILIIRFNGVGDIVMTMPSLKAIREAYPRATITWLVDERCAGAVKDEPRIDEVITLHRRNLELMPKLQALKKLWAFISDLRRRRFDLAIDLQGFSETSLLAWISGARYRAGHRVKPGIVDRAEFQGLAYNVPCRLPERTLHKVEYFFQIARSVGGQIKDPSLFFFIPQAQRAYARDFLRKNRVKRGSLVIGLNPGPADNPRCWSAANFARLGDLLGRKLKARVILRGSPGEETLVAEVLSRMKTRPMVACPTDLQQMAALVSLCRVNVSNDTGPMHVSAATGTPTLGLFRFAHPVHLRPWGDPRHGWIQTPDHEGQGNMDLITPEMVFDKVNEMLKNKS